MIETILKRKPHWPTFRKAFLDEACIERLMKRVFNTGDCVFTSVGTYLNREGPNGGCYGNIKAHRPMISFEIRLRPLKLTNNRHTSLYLIGWIGEYGNGSIMHISWQFPHVTYFCLDSCVNKACDFYRTVASAMYDIDDWTELHVNDGVDKDVQKFILQCLDR